MNAKPTASIQSSASTSDRGHLAALEDSPHETTGAASRVRRLSDPPRREPAIVPTIPGLAAAEAVLLDVGAGVVTLRFGNTEVEAKWHSSVDPVVIRRAIERGELLIAQQLPDGWLVIGVLRTSATPGLDVGDEYVIEARRVTLQGEHEVEVRSGAARFALAAIGRIESIAKHITSRASAVHKIIGRAIQLN